MSALKDTTFHATLFLNSGQVQHEIDARPSDAINLAIRTGAPIYVADEVMAAAGKAVPEELPDEIQPFELPAWIQRQLSELRQVKEK